MNPRTESTLDELKALWGKAVTEPIPPEWLEMLANLK